jgi:catalase
MAIRFMIGKSYTDIVANSHNGFFVGNGDDFLAMLKAIAASGQSTTHPSPIEAFLDSHPRALKVIVDSKPKPASFGTLAYYGNNAFIFVDSTGTKRAGRYQIIPEAGIHSIDSAAAARAGPNYMFDELSKRIAKGPIKFKLYVQLASPGDPTNDGSMVWPDNRKKVEMGELSITALAPDNQTAQRDLRFNPILITSGIELSDDPLVPLRSAVYAISVSHRH